MSATGLPPPMIKRSSFENMTTGPVEMRHLRPNEVYSVAEGIGGVKVEVEWTSTTNGLADLDVYVLLYDENSRFIQKLNIDHCISNDGAVRLEADMDALEDSKTHMECVHINFAEIDMKTTAMVLFVDGGPRNFQFITSVAVTCSEIFYDSAESGSDMMKKLESALQGSRHKTSLFRAEISARKDFQGIASMVLYKDGWHPDDSSRFSCCPVLEPVFLATTREKDEYCHTITVNTVPCLLKYRPRLFPSVKSICAALSSTSLPKLKRSFLVGCGLQKAAFTQVLFQQLYETKPELLESTEAAYTVAMLHELFGQIDFNGDGAVDWDEFTTFWYNLRIIDADKNSLIGSHDNAPGASDGGDTNVGSALNSYVVQYKEDVSMRDTVLSTYSPLAVLRHAPSIKRLLVLQEKRESCLMLDEQFNLIATLHPGKILGHEEKDEKFKVYDMCYIPLKDMYALVSSDHSLTVYKEHMAVSGRNCSYSVYNRIHFTFLHIKIVYSALNNILCTIDCNNTIYGWPIDGQDCIFEVSRHKSLITDMITIDKHNLFATCSLDRRVVLWSQSTRRVKGVLLGHKRGITHLSCGRDTLLTSGFECEARTWDLNLKEQQLLLRGHRLPITDSKIMCQDTTLDSDLRAITVDDSGEFRLWSIGINEMNDNSIATTLEIFALNGSSNKIRTKFSCILLPFDKRYSNSNYSNIIAGSSKLIHFKPEKITKEFLPPNCMLYSDINACLITAVGKSIFKYDVFTGGFQNSFDDICNSEITCFANDGKEGRRLFLGFADGWVILLNFASGQILSKVKAHTKSVTALMVRNDPRRGAVLYVGSSEGKLRTLVEHGGGLLCHSSLDETFRDQTAISIICAVPEVKLLLIAANSTNWGGWDCATLNNFFRIVEVEPITGMECIGGGGVYNRGSIVDYDSALQMEFEKVVTVAVCTSTCIRIYSIDTGNTKAVCSHSLIHSERLYFSKMVLVNYPQAVSMNYTGKLSEQYKEMLVVSSDEGRLVAWDIRHLRDESIGKFYNSYPQLLELVKMLIPHAEGGGMSRHTSSHQLKRKAEAEEGGLMIPIHGLEKLPDYLKQTNDSYDSSCDSSVSGSGDESEGSENSLESQSSLFSMTSKMGVIVDDLGSGSQTVGMAKTVSIISPLASPRDSGAASKKAPLSLLNTNHRQTAEQFQQQHPVSDKFPLQQVAFSPVTTQRRSKPRRRMRRHLHRADTVATMAISKDGILPREEDSTSVMSAFSWRAHTDLIQNMVALKEHGCIFTNSLDGFHRVWNLHQECLGEMALPNLTEKMQRRQKENKQAWKFVLEKIPVLPVHERVADELVSKIKGTDDRKFDKVKSRRAGMGGGNSRQTQALREVTKRDKQRNALLSDVGVGSRSFQSFGNSILKGLNDDEVGDEFALEASGEGNRGNKGLMADDDEGNHEQSRASEGGDGFVDDGSTISSPLKGGKKCLQKSQSMTVLQKSKHLVSARVKDKVRRKKVENPYVKKIPSVFGDKEMWNNPQDVTHNKVLAFSENSISNSHHEGYIDEEGHAILRRMQRDKDKLDVYRRAQPQLMLKNVGLCTSIEFPSSDMSNSELSFGQQKLMYKNANIVIEEKIKLSDRAKQNARHALAKARIKNSASSVGNLVQFKTKPLHSIALPTLELTTTEDEAAKATAVVHVLESSRQGQRRGGLLSAMPPSPLSSSSTSQTSTPSGPPPRKTKLDHIKISQYIGKLMDAEDGALTQWEKDLQIRRQHEKSDKLRQSKRREKPTEKKHSMLSIERRLSATIRHVFAARGELADAEKEARMPTAKDLLPSYTIADVRSFLDTFQRVDEDMSGTLDVNEWVEFLTGDHNKTITKHQARTLFNTVDMTSQGLLSVADLVPVVFSKADKQLQDLLSNYLEEQIARSGLKGKDGVTTLEVEALFEGYDVHHIGYITVSLLREKIKAFRLPVTAVGLVTAPFAEFDDDELLNISEFMRLFDAFIIGT